MVNENTQQCPDCGGELEFIKIVDATQPGMAAGVTTETSPASHHVQLQYAAEDAERSGWSKRFPTAGHLRGRMCTQCGRVVLYAVPRDA